MHKIVNTMKSTNNKKTKKGNNYNYFEDGGLAAIGGASGASGMLGAATGLLGTAMSNLKVPEVKLNPIKASNNDEMMAAFGSNYGINLGRTDVLSSALSGAASGGSAGAAAGPWGAAIGAGVGLLSNGITAAIGNENKRKKEVEANAQMMGNLNAKSASIAAQGADANLANYAAFGGQIFADGGDFTNGITIFNNGGTHEQNPLGGVPQGIGDNGQPNLVEEGEVKYKDYIYSNRLKANERLLNEVGLPTKYKGKTFGDIAKIAQKESQERPNDPVSQNGLQDSMDKLKKAQEIMKLKKQQREQVQAFKNGGELMFPYSEQAVHATTSMPIQPITQFAKGGDINHPFALGTALAVAKRIPKPTYIPNDSIEYLNHLGAPVRTNSMEFINKNKGFIDTYTKQGLNFKDAFHKVLEDNSAEKIGSSKVSQTLKFAKGGALPQGIEPNMEQLVQQIAAWIQQGMAPQQIMRQLITAGVPKQQAQQLVMQVAQQAQQSQQQAAPMQQFAFGGNIFADGDLLTLPTPVAGIDINSYAHTKGLDGIVVSGAAPKQPLDINTAIKNDSNRVTYGQNTNPTPPPVLPFGSEALRYAPAVGSGIMALTDAFGLTNKPDYTAADTIGGLSVKGERVNNYLAYKPMDRDFYQNKLNANAGATRAGLANASNGNRATLAAGLLGADYNYGENMGNLAQKAEEYNLGQKQRVEEFNRGTNQFNAQQSNWEQGINTDLKSKSAMLRADAKNSSNAAKSANLNNFLDNLGGVGKEEAAFKMIQNNPALYYEMTHGFDIKYKGNQKKNGGKLNKKGEFKYV